MNAKPNRYIRKVKVTITAEIEQQVEAWSAPHASTLFEAPQYPDLPEGLTFVKSRTKPGAIRMVKPSSTDQ